MVSHGEGGPAFAEPVRTIGVVVVVLCVVICMATPFFYLGRIF